MNRIMITLLTIFCVSTTWAQTSPSSVPAAPATPTTLQAQYKYLKTDLELINGFRMIKMYTMDRFWNIVTDTIQVQKAKTKELAKTLITQQQEIANLNVSVNKLQEEKQLLETKVDNMIVFGNAYAKSGVVTVGLFVMLGLLVLSGFLFIMSRSALNTSRELRKLNESMYQEFDSYKRNSVEKEVKILRELQNYRNKLAELKIA